MSDEGRWLTYEELGQLIGRTPNGARMFASRRNWPRRSSNRIGERATVLVPAEIGKMPPRAPNDAEQKKAEPLANGSGERATARAAIDALTEQLAIANRRLDEERGCGARAMERAATEISDVRRQLDEERARTVDALTAERIARDEAAGLRAELEARKRWSLSRRVRGR
jgi:hypothetical protein